MRSPNFGAAKSKLILASIGLESAASGLRDTLDLATPTIAWESLTIAQMDSATAALDMLTRQLDDTANEIIKLVAAGSKSRLRAASVTPPNASEAKIAV